MKIKVKQIGLACVLGTLVFSVSEAPISYAKTSVGGSVSMDVLEVFDLTGRSVIPGSLGKVRATQKSEALQEGSLAIVKGDRGYGVLGVDGTETIDASHEKVNVYDGRYFSIKDKGEKETKVFDIKGQDVKAEVEKKDAEALAARRNDPVLQKDSDYYRFFFFFCNKRYGVANIGGEVVLPPVYKDVLAEFSEGRAFVKTNKGERVAIDAEGNVLFSIKEYDEVGPYRGGLAEVRRRVHKFGLGLAIGILSGNMKTGQGDRLGKGLEFTSYDGAKRGYIDRDGRVVIDSKLDKVYPISAYGAVVEDQGKTGFVGRTGEMIVPYGDYEPVEMDELFGFLGLRDKSTEKYGVRSVLTGDVVVPFIYDGIQFSSQGIVVGKTPTEQQFLQVMSSTERQKLFSLSSDAKFTNFDEMGYMWVEKDTLLRTPETGTFKQAFDGYKIVDLKGNVLFEAKEMKIEKVQPFHFGYSPVKVDGKWGVMKPDGTWIVEPKYKEIQML